MSYSEPRQRPLIELAADLASADPGVVGAALIDAAHHAPPAWAQQRIVAAAEHADVGVRRTALVALSVLARRRVLDRNADVERVVRAALAEVDLRGTAADLLDDIDTYGAER